MIVPKMFGSQAQAEQYAKGLAAQGYTDYKIIPNAQYQKMLRDVKRQQQRENSSRPAPSKLYRFKKTRL